MSHFWQKMFWMFAALTTVGVACFVLLPLPVGCRCCSRPRVVSCLQNTKNLALAMQLYVENWDGFFPDAAQWSVLLASYVGNPSDIFCRQAKIPPTGSRRLSRAIHSYGYAMNSELSHQKLAAIVHPEKTPCFFESERSGINMHDAVQSLPEPERHMERRGIWRTETRVNAIGFVDGKAKYMTNAEVRALRGQKSSP